MAPISTTASFMTGLDSTEIRERALAWFAHLTHRLDFEEPGRLIISSGSQVKMRLVGGAFIAASSLPTRTEIQWRGGDVTVTAQDAVGFGVKTGMKGKYEQWCADIVGGLRDALGGAAPAEP